MAKVYSFLASVVFCIVSAQADSAPSAAKDYSNFQLRLAQEADIPALRELIRVSAAGLSVGYYTKGEIEALNQYVFGVDSQLIVDETYFVVEHEERMVACGGWSKRATLFGGDQCAGRIGNLLDPAHDAAKIRAFFVHPEYARWGLGRKLMEWCEQEIRAHGFSRIELMSTLPGVPFYEKYGFTGLACIEYTLPNGMVVNFKPMAKKI